MDTLTDNKPARRTTFVADISAGVLLAGIALLLLFVLIPYGVDAPRKVKFAALHPAYYPRIVAWCLLIFGCATIIVALRKIVSVSPDTTTLDLTTPDITKKATRSSSTGTDTLSDDSNTLQQGVKDKTSRQQLFSLSVLATVFVGVTFFLPTLGFPLTTGLALLGLMPLAGEWRIWVVITTAICLPMLLYLFFTKIANIPIPGGVLDPWLLKL